MLKEIEAAVAAASKKLFQVDIRPELSRTEEQFGDYSTNIAMQLAGQLGKTPRSVAEELATELQNVPDIENVSIAGPGFLNFKVKDKVLFEAAQGSTTWQKINKGKEILAEFGDPNPFKEMHIGHLYTAIIGDAIAGLLEATGARVQRLSYHGDVGLHVAKWLFGVHQELGWDTEAASKAIHEKGIGYFYALGAKAYEQDEQAKKEIEAINNQVYARDHEGIERMYRLGKNLSFDKFDEIFQLLGVEYKKRYLESDSAEEGMKFVKENIGKVFEQSDGAVVYKGEKAGLHTRVFINSRGLPTYETKDLGLAELKNKDFPASSQSVIITAHEQSEYFKVMLAALSEIDKELAAKTRHLPHGFVNLSSGKMSSRSGNVYAATDLLLEVKDMVHQQYPASLVRKEVTFAAVKYAFLKHRLGSDLVFDIEESVSLEGNSGPYLQYAHARASSILAKAPSANTDITSPNLDDSERSMARKISEYPEVIEKAAVELMPHHIAIYLYELAQSFNRFYEKSRIIGDERQDIRLNLTAAYQKVLQNGLGILNINAPERM